MILSVHVNDSTISKILSNHRIIQKKKKKKKKENVKKSRGNTILNRVLQRILLQTQREDRVNTTSVWSPHLICYHYYDAVEKPENNGSFT